MGEPSKQRWFFGGKLLSDKTRIGDANIPPGHVVQCILNEQHQTSENAKEQLNSKKSEKQP